jgi:hypothetical protein
MNFKYEHKNHEGRTLFLIEAVHHIIEDDLCYGDVLIHLPIHLPYLSKDIDLKIKSLETMFQDINIDFDPILYMQEIAILIEGIPNIEKLYAPDFLLDENGDYDDSLINNYLNIFNIKKLSYSSIPCKDYAWFKLKGFYENTPSYCSAKSDSWLFNIISMCNSDFVNKDCFKHIISTEIALNLIGQNYGDVLFDIYENTGYFVLSHDDEKDHFFLLYNDENSNTKCYFFLIDDVEKILEKNQKSSIII